VSRILYLAPWPASNTGGNKVAFRHVEALNTLGYRAVIRRPDGGSAPSWFSHAAPMEDASAPVSADDILVIPEDSAEALLFCADLPNRKVVFCQNPYALLSYGLARLPAAKRQAYRAFMTCSAGVAATIARYFDYELISVVPAFADERLFRPAPKERLIACTPRKRPTEQQAIRYLFSRLYKGSAGWRWTLLETATEAEVAGVMGRASVFLSLARMEALSITTLEAMASGCLIAGFTGIGPREYLTPTNGLWVPEDECEAAARALVEAVAVAVAEAGGGPAALMRHAALATAARWSHAAFVEALHAFWRDEMGVAP
jgi:hypothetical protein